MPIWILQLIESLVPAILQIIVNAYMKKEQTPEVAQKVQAHQAALDSLKKV